MPRSVIIGGKILLSLIAACIVAAIALIVYLGTPYAGAQVGAWLTHHSGRNVALEGKIETRLWSRTPRLMVSGIKVGNAEWSADPLMFEAERIEFSLKPWELLRGRLVVPELIIDRPHIVLEKNTEGATNWQFTQNPQVSVLKQPLPEERGEVPIISRLRITDGRLTYRDPAQHIMTQVDISTVSGESGKDEAITLVGKGSYQQQPFSLSLQGASVLQLRESDTPYPFTLDTVIGGTSAHVEGTVRDPIRLAAFDVALTLKGRNAADLFPITGIALPPTPPYRVSGRLAHEREGKEWHFEDFAGVMGGSDVKGDVAWYPDATPRYLKGRFTSENLDMVDLAGFVGAQRAPADSTRVLPDTPLDISRFLAMNADVTFHGKRIKKPDLLNDFYMQAHLENGVLRIKPLSFGIAGGTITAEVTVEGLKTPPLVRMNVDFRRLSLTSFFAPLAERYGKENVSAGLLGGRASLRGTGKSLRDILADADGNIAFGLDGGQLSRLLLDLAGLDLFRAAGLVLTGTDEPVPLHCMAAYFSVTSGYMETRAFLIDTDIIAIRAEGGANLADETIDMRLHTTPKEASLFSLHSPIEIGGTLKKPRIGVNKAAVIARGGVAAALAALAPPAAWLAFIQSGLGKDGNCAAFIEHKDTVVE